MNERIKLLACQADWDDEFREDFDIEKFAELIIKECADICDDNNNFLQAKILKKHFGVEEK